MDGSSEPAALHGRSAELALLMAGLDRAASGTMHAAVVEGEAGIGKTRLLDAALEVARSRDFHVVVGRTDEIEQARPFGPLAEALGCTRAARDPRRAAIAGLLSGDSKGSPDPIEPNDEPGLRYRIVDALVDLVEEIALDRPVALGLEDLQWADPSTLLAVRSLTRQLPYSRIALFATRRPLPSSHDLEQLIELIARDGGQRIVLHPLDDAAVTRLVSELAGAAPSDSLLQEVSGAAGNPLFVNELVKALADEGLIEVVDGLADLRESSLPPSLRLTILRRLSFLDDQALGLLRVASMLGSTFSLSDVATVVDRPSTSLLEPLQRLLRAGVVEERGDQLAFRHDLIREAVYGDLPADARATLHLDIGRRLAAAGASVIRVAEHLALGARAGDSETLGWLQEAAREAAPSAPAVAVRLLERALELAGDGGRRRTELVADLVPILLWSGRPQQAETYAREALAADPAPTLEGGLRLGLVRALAAQGRPDDVIREVDHAIRESAVTADLRSQLQAEAANALAFGQDLDLAERVAREAVTSGAAADSDGAATALLVLSDIARTRGSYAESLVHATEALERSAARGGSRLHWRPEIFLAMTLRNLDRFEEAESAIRRGRLADERTGNVSYLPVFHYESASVMFAAGRWDEAAAEARSGLALAEEVGLGMLRVWPRGLLALMAVHRGDLEAAEGWIRVGEDRSGETDPPDSPIGGSSPWLLLARVLLHEARGETEAALAILGGAWEVDTVRGTMGSWRLLAPDYVRLALQGQHHGLASQVSTALQDAGHADVSSFRGAALRCRGLADDDVDLLVSSVEAYRLGPRAFERALACADAAAALGRVGRASDARQLFDDALATFEELDARREVARTLASMRELGIGRKRRGARKRPATGWEALTPAELEVIQLAAEGLTNPDIGRRLFISRRTVQTHLAHAFPKLGITSRVQLAAEVARGAGRRT